MRQVYSAARAAFWILIATALAQSGFAQLSVTNYVIVNSLRISVTQWQYTYSAAVLNQGPALTALAATLTTSVPNIVVVPNHNVLNWGPVAANSQVQAKNTFTINVDRSVQFKLTDLHWTFVTNGGVAPPVANPGPNQTGTVGTTINLNGSGSTNPSGIGTLTYSWQFTVTPPASSATLVNPNTVTPSFFMDVAGTYVIQLTVSNGLESSSASVTVSTEIPPVANPGPNQSVALNAVVTLNGSASTDSNGNTLTYSWQFTSVPTGSTTTLNGANTVNPTFTVDKPGKYVVQLVVNDGVANSSPASVTIDQNSPPVANAGQNQSNVSLNSPVQLNGSQSTDVDGDSLTYKWSLITLPAGSRAVLSATNIVNPTFTPDVAGPYVAQLIVNDGVSDSSPSTVTITTAGIVQAPTANAGSPQKLAPGATVSLNGSGSFDPQNMSLTYSWSFTSKPATSKAVLSNTSAVSPTFVGDLPGTYVVQLVVSNGTLASAPSTVTIGIDTPPVANAGPNQSVQQGANVLLDGSASSDTNGNPLSYSWTFTTQPAGSSAVLSGPNTVAPTFVAAVAGTYVVQLIVNDGITSSNPPATVTITAVGSKVITLSPSPMTIGTTTGAGTLTVTLASPAGASGQVVTLSSSNKSAATVPASVTVPANASSATVSVTPVAVGTTTITGSASGFTSGNTTVNVVQATTTITFDFPQVGKGGQITGHATLSVPAATATNIGLNATPSGVVTVPSSVPLAAGGTTASFTITGVSINYATIRGVVPGYASVSAQIQVVSQPLITMPSTLTVQAGQPPVTLNISLQNAAPPAGTTVTLTSADNTKATVTPSVFIAAGATTPATQPTVTGLALGTVSISASAPNFASGSTSVTVTAGPPATITAGGTPQSAAANTAFAALTATVQDSLGNPVSGQSVTFTAPAVATAPGVTIATTPVTTNASGVASVTLTANGKAGGPYTVTAALGSLTTNYSLTNLSGKPAAVALASGTSGSGQSAQILSQFTNPLRALVTDGSGNPVPQAVVVFTAPTGNNVPTGTFSNGTATISVPAGPDGVASTVFTAGNVVSPLSGGSQTPYTVSATVSGVSTPAKFSLTNLAGPPVNIAATAGATQNISVTGIFGTALQATVTDQGGNPVGGVQVTFTVNPVNGASASFPSSLTTVQATTAANGVATAPTPLTAGQTAGTFTVTATFTGATTPATFTLTNNPGSAASITATTGASQSAPINTAYGTMQVTVKDLYQNLVNTGTVTFTVVASGNGAGGKFPSSPATATVTNGIATAPAFTANTTVGAFTVNATISGASSPAQFSLNNTVGLPATIAQVSGTGQSVQGGSQPVNALKVIVKDVGGNVVPNATVTFTLQAGAGGQGGTFANNATSATAATDATGTATMPQFTANYTLGTYTIAASTPGANNATVSLSSPFSVTNIPGVPTTISVNMTTASAPINAAFPTITATIKDAGGNPVGSGIGVVFTAPATSGAPGVTVGTTTQSTNTSSQASVTLTANATKGGPYNLVITSGSAPSVTVSLTNQPGPVTTITASAGATQFIPNTQQFPTAPAVTVTDASSDLLSGVPVTFTIVPNAQSGASGTFVGGGTMSIQTTSASGIATAPMVTANGKIGTFTITATAPTGVGSNTVSLATPFSMTNQSGPPVAPATPGTGTSGQSAVVNQNFGTLLSATLKDAGGNLAAGYAVTFTVNPGANGASGNFGGASVFHATSDANGLAKATTALTANTITGTFTVTMTVDTVPGSVFATFTMTNTFGSPANIAPVAGTANPINVAVGTALTTPLQVNVTDQYGNMVGSQTTVTFTIVGVQNAQGGKFGNSQTINETTASGVATLPASAFTANTFIGAYTITAGVAGASTPATFNMVNTPGPVTQVIAAASSTPQNTPAGSQFANPLIVTLKDANGNLVANQQVVFSAPTTAGQASGTFQGSGATATVTSGANGQAQAPVFTANAFAGGPYNVTATANSVTTNFSLTNKAGNAVNITAVAGTTPQSSGLTVAFSHNLAVTLTDANNNPVSGVTVTFTVVPAGGAGATFTGSLTTVTAVTLANGQATAAVLTPNNVLGSYTVTATAPGANNTTLTLTPAFALTNTVGPPKTLAITSGNNQSAQIGSAFASPLVVTVTDIAGNPIPNWPISFTAPGAGASLTFAGSNNTVTVNTNASGVAQSPAMTASGSVSTPNYTVTVAAVGLSPALTNTFTLTNTAGPPATITISTGNNQSQQTGFPYATLLSVIVKDSGGNFVSGAPVTFTAPASGASGFFGAPSSVTVTTSSTGVATAPTFIANLLTGTVHVTATVPGANNTTVSLASPFSLTNTACVIPTGATACNAISMANVSVGQNLEVLVPVSLTPASSLNNFAVTITSSDPTQVMLTTNRPSDGLVSSLTVTFNQGVATENVWVVGVGNGSSTPPILIATANGYQFGVSHVTLTPSAFVLSVNGQLGASLVTNNGNATTMALLTYQVDSSGNPIGSQGLANTVTANVTINSTNGSVGSISPASPISISGPVLDTQNGTPVTFTADPTNIGSTVLSIAPLTGFATALTGGSVPVTVNSSQMSVSQSSPTIGQNLEITGNVLLSGQPGSPVPVTITSSNPSQLLFSASPTAAGSASITVTIQPPSSRSPQFYIQSLGNSGQVAYTVSAPGYKTLNANATLAPSGIIIWSPNGLGQPYSTTSLSTPTTVNVEADVLDANNNPVAPQAVAGGLTVAVTIAADPSIGTITGSPVQIPSGQADAPSNSVQFVPNSSITSPVTNMITLTEPAGFNTPAIGQSISVTVNEPNVVASQSTLTIGNGLQVQNFVTLGAPAPAPGLQVTITSNNPSNVKLAANPTDVGSSSITMTITTGGASAPFYVQGFGTSGTFTYTITAPGFKSKPGFNVTLTNSGLVMVGPLGLGAPGANESVTSGPDSRWTIYTSALDASKNYLQLQSAAATTAATVNLASQFTNIGTVPPSLTISGGITPPASCTSTCATFTFTPVAAGNTNVSMTSSFGVANNLPGQYYSSIPVIVGN